jgi:hypothetical protein
MNPEEQFSRQVCRILDQGTRDLDPGIVARLRAARYRALEQRARLAYPGAAIVGAGGTAFWGDGGSHPVRTMFAMLALAIGMGVAYYWNGFDQAQVNEEVDIALLSDELPPKAYLDPGFQAWLSHYAQSAR